MWLEFLRKLWRKSLKEVKASDSFRNSLKSKLSERILADSLRFESDKLIEIASREVRRVKPSPYMRVTILEKLLEKYRGKYQSSLSIFKVFVRSTMALAAMFSLFVTICASFFVSSPVTYASKFSYINEVNGEVYVQRKGETFLVEAGMPVYEGDIIKTNSGATAEVIFFDDSIVRVDSKSELNVFTLNMANLADSEVEIGLRTGKIWAHSPSLVSDRSEFNVFTPKLDIEVDDKAVFELEVKDQGNVKIDSHSKKVKVVQSLNSKSDVFVVKKGDSLDLFNGRVTLFERDSETEWAEENLNKDEDYNDSLQKKYKEELKEGAGILPDDPRYFLKQIGETTQILFTFDQEEKYDLELQFAENRLLEASVLLDEGKEELAKEQVEDYKEKVEKVYDTAEEIVVEKPDQASSIKQKVDEKVSAHKKAVTVVAESPEMKILEDTVYEVESLVSDDPGQKIVVELEQIEKEVEEEEIVTEEVFDKVVEDLVDLSDDIKALDEITKGKVLDKVEEIKDEIVEVEIFKEENPEPVVVDDSVEKEEDSFGSEFVEKTEEIVVPVIETSEVEVEEPELKGLPLLELYYSEDDF